MNRFALPLAAAVVALNAGCAEPPREVPEPPPPPVFAPGECDGQAAQFAVGQPFNAPLGEQARIKARAERLRTVRPGQMVTMEFDARRLTIEIDAQEKVAAVRCG